MFRAAAFALASVCLLGLTRPVRPSEDRVFRLWTKAEMADAAAVHASKYVKSRQKFLRYFDLGSVPPKDRVLAVQVLGYVLNSLSLNDLIFPAGEVAGTELALVFVDTYYLRAKGDVKGLEKLIAALDKLGELGSGAAPFPEPYYHLVDDSESEVEKVTYQDQDYWVIAYYRDQHGRDYTVREKRTRKAAVKTTEKVKSRKVALGAHLNKGTAIGLAALTETASPIFDYYWFLSNAMSEPRYHELLGLGESEKDVQELGGFDAARVAKDSSQTRSVVLFSEVAHHNRALRRTPTGKRYGRGSYHESFDFKSSVRVKDVLKDLLLDTPDAKEIIFVLPNGLQGFSVVDGKGKRLDKADADVALNNSTRYKDKQVRTAFHCIDCHLRQRGWLEPDDEVRALAARPIQLLVDSVSGKNPQRGEDIRKQYLGIDFNELLLADQAVTEAAVAAATKWGGKSLTCPQTAKALSDAIYRYQYEGVSLSSLALTLGYPQDEVLAALQTAGLDPVFVVLRSGRKARRDQVEAGFAQAAAVLYLGKHKD